MFDYVHQQALVVQTHMHTQHAEDLESTTLDQTNEQVKMQCAV